MKPHKKTDRAETSKALRQKVSNDVKMDPRPQLHGADTNRRSKSPTMAPCATPMRSQNSCHAAVNTRNLTHASIVDVRGNLRGHIDEECMHELIDQLFQLADGARRNDVVIDLSQVRSWPDRLEQTIDVFRSHLSHQSRRVIVYGML